MNGARDRASQQPIPAKLSIPTLLPDVVVALLGLESVTSCLCLGTP